MTQTPASDMTLRRGAAWLVAALAIETLLLRLRQATGFSSREVWFDLAVAAGVAAICVDAVRRGLRPSHAYLLALVTVAVAFVGVGRLDGSTGADHRGSYAFVALAVPAAAALGRIRTFVSVYLVVAVAHVTASGVAQGGEGALAAADEVVVVGGACLALAFVVRAVQSAMTEVDVVRQVRAYVARHGDRAELEREANARVQRLLHDDVISALVTIERSSNVEASAAATAALAALDDAVDPGGWILGENGAVEPIAGFPATEFAIADGFEVNQWPIEVIAAMTGAVSEALRNVTRHAGVDEAFVSVKFTRRTLTVVVKDSGVGFDSAKKRAGFGIRSSIVGRMADVGGKADVQSGVRGTQVRLSWTSGRGGRQSGEWDRAYWAVALPAGGVTSLIVAPLASFALAQQWLAMRYVGANDHPRIGVAIAVLLAVWVVVLARRVSSGPLTPRFVLAGLGITYLAVACGLWAAGAGSLLGFESWVVGCGESLLLVMALVAPIRWTVVATVGLMSIVIGAAVMDPTIAPADVLAAVAGPMLPVAALLTLRTFVRRNGAAADRESWSLATAAVKEEQTKEATAVLRRRSAEVRTVVGPFLRRVADGEARPGSHEVVAEARALASSVRDDLNAPGLVASEVGTAVAAARQRGASVTIRPMDLDDVLRDRMQEVLIAVARQVAAGHKVVVMQESITQGKITVTPPIATMAETVTLDARMDRWSSDQFASRVLVGVDPSREQVRTGVVRPRGWWLRLVDRVR